MAAGPHRGAGRSACAVEGGLGPLRPRMYHAPVRRPGPPARGAVPHHRDHREDHHAPPAALRHRHLLRHRLRAHRARRRRQSFAWAVLWWLAWRGFGPIPLWVQGALLVAVTRSGIRVAGELEKRHGEDPKLVVIDEVAGMIVTYLGRGHRARWAGWRASSGSASSTSSSPSACAGWRSWAAAAGWASWPTTWAPACWPALPPTSRCWLLGWWRYEPDGAGVRNHRRRGRAAGGPHRRHQQPAHPARPGRRTRCRSRTSAWCPTEAAAIAAALDRTERRRPGLRQRRPGLDARRPDPRRGGGLGRRAAGRGPGRARPAGGALAGPGPAAAARGDAPVPGAGRGWSPWPIPWARRPAWWARLRGPHAGAAAGRAGRSWRACCRWWWRGWRTTGRCRRGAAAPACGARRRWPNWPWSSAAPPVRAAHPDLDWSWWLTDWGVDVRLAAPTATPRRSLEAGGRGSWTRCSGRAGLRRARRNRCRGWCSG